MGRRGLGPLRRDGRDAGAPVEESVIEQAMLFLAPSRALTVPFAPPSMRHHGGYIAFLERLVAWLGEPAETLEIELCVSRRTTECGHPCASFCSAGVCEVEREGGEGPRYRIHLD